MTFPSETPFNTIRRLTKEKEELLEVLKDLEYLLDLKLPVDVKFGGGTNKAGTTIRTLAYRIMAFNEVRNYAASIDPNDIEGLKQLMRCV
jgi:hypothetical protein